MHKTRFVLPLRGFANNTKKLTFIMTVEKPKPKALVTNHPNCSENFEIIIFYYKNSPISFWAENLCSGESKLVMRNKVNDSTGQY